MTWVRKPYVRPEPLTCARIYDLAKVKGVFEVSWRWRDDRLRATCYRLVRAGHLQKRRGEPGRDYFEPGPNGRPPERP